MTIHKKRRWDLSVIAEAQKMRRGGASLGKITEELSVPKSTLHLWVRGKNIPRKFSLTDRRNWAKYIQPAGAKANHERRVKRLELIDSAVKTEVLQVTLSKDTLKAMLSMLYLAEGSKTRGAMVFANTDPRLIVLYVLLLRKCYQIDESKFRVRLHLHWYHKATKIKRYWSDLLCIPLTQFNKTYHKKRGKEKRYRKNIGGICFVKYNSEYLREEIIRFGWALTEKCNSVSP